MSRLDQVDAAMELLDKYHVQTSISYDKPSKIFPDCVRINEFVIRNKKMWYKCQWNNSPLKSQFVKVNHYRSKYCLQHEAPKITSVKPFKQEYQRQRSNLYKKIWNDKNHINNPLTSGFWLLSGCTRCILSLWYRECQSSGEKGMSV